VLILSVLEYREDFSFNFMTSVGMSPFPALWRLNRPTDRSRERAYRSMSFSSALEWVMVALRAKGASGITEPSRRDSSLSAAPPAVYQI
jgi:hypothetical protein